MSKASPFQVSHLSYLYFCVLSSIRNLIDTTKRFTSIYLTEYDYSSFSFPLCHKSPGTNAIYQTGSLTLASASAIYAKSKHSSLLRWDWTWTLELLIIRLGRMPTIMFLWTAVVAYQLAVLKCRNTEIPILKSNFFLDRKFRINNNRIILPLLNENHRMRPEKLVLDPNKF